MISAGLDVGFGITFAPLHLGNRIWYGAVEPHDFTVRRPIQRLHYTEGLESPDDRNLLVLLFPSVQYSDLMSLV